MDDEFFTECREAFSEKLSELWRDAAHSDPLLSQIRRVTYNHGMIMILVDVEGVQRSSELEQMGSTFELRNEVLESGDAEAFRKVIDSGVQQIRKQVFDLFFRRVDDATKSVGNIIDMAGKPLTGKALCDMFERIHIDFDDQGRPRMPTFVFHPDLHDRVRELLDQPDVKLRLDVILREKWLAKYTLKLQ